MFEIRKRVYFIYFGITYTFSNQDVINIFTNSDRNPNGVTTGESGGNPSMAYVSSQDRGYGFRSITGAEDEGWDLSPNMNHADRPYGFDFYDWGATVDAVTTDPSYHNFSCSKCHNPHASRLPRLMISNCLDTNHNTWDTKAGVDMIPATALQILGIALTSVLITATCRSPIQPRLRTATGLLIRTRLLSPTRPGLAGIM